jgi:hypothetical protein
MAEVETLYIVHDDGTYCTVKDSVAFWEWFTSRSMILRRHDGDGWSAFILLDPIQTGPVRGHRLYEVRCSRPGLDQVSRWFTRAEADAHLDFLISWEGVDVEL